MGNVRVRPDTGKLYFDFQYRGERCREYSLLPDSKESRRRMRRVMKQIDNAMVTGQFRYADFFPHSTKADYFTALENGGSRETSAGHYPLFSDWVATWYAENKIRWREATRESNLGTAEKHLIPRFGDLPINAITKSEVLRFRSDLAVVSPDVV